MPRNAGFDQGIDKGNTVLPIFRCALPKKGRLIRNHATNHSRWVLFHYLKNKAIDIRDGQSTKIGECYRRTFAAT